jgi:hypothetical protein
MKKQQMRYARWYGFGCHAGAKGLIQSAAVLDDSWAPDEAMDRLAATLPSAQAGGGSFDGSGELAALIRDRRRDAAP